MTCQGGATPQRMSDK